VPPKPLPEELVTDITSFVQPSYDDLAIEPASAKPAQKSLEFKFMGVVIPYKLSLLLK